jgi:hypothetical protein
MNISSALLALGPASRPALRWQTANGYDETVFDHRMHEFLLSVRLAAEQATESSVPSGQSMRGI